MLCVTVITWKEFDITCVSNLSAIMCTYKPMVWLGFWGEKLVVRIIEAIDRIRDFHGRLDFSRFDKVIYGDVEKECTGIVTTCCATVEVIRKTAQAGANLIVCHEDLFFTSVDDETLVEGVALVEEKKRLLDETGITVWRDHDHMHGNENKPFNPQGGKPDFKNGPPMPKGPRTKTDYIFYGIMKELGWDDYVVDDIKKPLLYEIPETTVPELCNLLLERFNLNGVRIVGKKDAIVRRVFFVEHVSDHGDERLYKRMDELNADVFIPLEIVDWTLSEYIRDAVALGQNKAILEMGHFNFEEPGMKYMAEAWLPGLFDEKMPIFYIQSGDSFEYILRG